MSANSKVKHTPGPWRIDRVTDDFEISIVGRPECKCTRYGVKGEWDVCKLEEDNADTSANARLIAAAPDLLEALQGMLEWSTAINNLGGFVDTDKAEAAVIKATGNA